MRGSDFEKFKMGENFVLAVQSVIIFYVSVAITNLVSLFVYFLDELFYSDSQFQLLENIELFYRLIGFNMLSGRSAH